MIKLLHTADIHLDSPLRSLALRDADLRTRVEVATRTAFSRLVEFALNEGVTALLIAGDLFDGAERSARTGAFVTGQFDRLRRAGIRVFYIKGNHDAENPVTGALDLPDNVHVFDGRGGKVALTDDIWIHGVSFSGKSAPDSLLPRFSAPVPGGVNIAMLHTSLGGAAGHGEYAPCSVSELKNMGFDYWALGHVHRRQVHAQDPWIVMPGMPQGRDIGETGPKTATLLTVENGQITLDEVPSSAVEFRADRLEITDTDSDDDLRQSLREHLRSCADTLASEAGVLRLTLSGQPARHWQILRDRAMWTETVAEMARETGDLWLEELHFDLTAPQQAASGNATDELADLMTQIAAEPGFSAAALAELDTVLSDLPTALRARLIPDEDSAAALARDLASDGARDVLARMKGANG